MKKQLFLSSAILAGLAWGGMTSFADDVENGAAEGGSIETSGTINFINGDLDPVHPVDPTDPTNPVDPTDPTTPVGGALSIDYVSSFKFGKQIISSIDEVYSAKLDKKLDGEMPNYIQVSDRRGTLAGWSLSVKQNAQFTTTLPDGTSKELAGAKLTLAKADLVGTTSEEEGNMPTEVAKQEIDLSISENTPLVTAQTGSGAGTWVYRFGKDNTDATDAVRLSVPGKSMKLVSEYKTKLLWTLANTPGNN